MKQNKFNTWLTSLLVMVMLAFVGQTAMAQDAEVTLDFGYSSKTVNGVVVTTYCSTWGNHLNPCNSGEYIQFAAPENMVITKIELTNTYKWSGDFSNLTVNSGTLAAQSGTSTWTGSSNEVIITVSGTIDVMFDAANIWIESTGGEEPTPDDGSKTYTYNFNGSAIPYVTGGASSTLTSGKNLQVGDVFTAEGGTLTFTAVATAWSNSAQRLRLGSGTAFTIAAPEGYLISEIVFNTDANTLSGLSATGLTFNSTTKATWTGSAASVPVSVTADSWVQTIKVKVVPASVEPTTYTVNVSNAPTGAAVVLDGNDLTAGGQITVEKILGLTNLEITEPSGYYAEKEYDATTHTFTVTFKAYLQYPVAVTGTTDANAGVVYDGVTYHNGESVMAKAALTAADVTAAEVSGLEGTVSLDGTTFTVAYKAPAYIEFITTGLSGSGENMYNMTIGGVTINGAVYSGYLNIWNSSWTATISSSSFEIEKIEFECVANFDMGCSVGSMDNSTKTWTGSAKSVTFTAGGDLLISRVRVYLKTPELQEYTVSITGNPSEAKLIYGTDQYANGDSFTAAVSESDLSATEIAGYVYNITIDGTTINVVYSEAPSIKLDYVTVNWGTDHLESGAELEKIEGVQVYFQDAIDYIDGVPTGMTVTDGAGNEQTITYCYMQGSYDSSWNYIYNGFYFGFNNTITTPGTYTLHIPAGAIKNTTTGMENKEINFQFVIPTPVQFAAPVLTPAEGNVESLKEFTLTAPTGVEFDTTRSLINITINGNTENIYNYEYATDGSALTFSLNSEYTTDGTVTVVLPLGFVRSTVGEYCPEVTATYTVVYPWYQFETWGGLNPASGSELKSLSTITIDAPTNVTFDCTSEGEARNVTIKVGGVDETVEANVYADHIVLNYATTAVGSYDFVIPASTFAANSATKGNKEFSFSYAIQPTLKVGEVTWTTFCYDYNFTLPDGYTPYIIKTAEDGVATPVEVLGAPKTETIKGYIYNYMGDPDMQATVNGDEITAPNFDGKVQVTFGGDFSVGGDYYDVYSGAWVEVVGLNGTEVVSVSPRSWDPYSYESYNFNTTTISGGIRIEWNGYSYFGGLDINIAIAGEYEKPVIPANTGILVQGDPAQDITYEKTYAAASDVSGNILTGCTADVTVTSDADHLYYKFSLNANRDAGSEGFYWDSADGHSINMHGGKAYLILDATSSIRGFRLFGEETESISNVQAGSENAPAFNLQGQRVNKNNFRSGLYIQNGKKVLVK